MNSAGPTSRPRKRPRTAGELDVPHPHPRGYANRGGPGRSLRPRAGDQVLGDGVRGDVKQRSPGEHGARHVSLLGMIR